MASLHARDAAIIDLGKYPARGSGGHGRLCSAAMTMRAGEARPRLDQTVRGGLSRPPGMMPSTCSPPSMTTETAEPKGERSMGAARIWTA